MSVALSLAGATMALSLTLQDSRAMAADCKKASCGDAAWVKACNADEACKMFDQLKSVPTTKARGFVPPGLPDQATEVDVKRLGPKLRMLKKPGAVSHTATTPYVTGKPSGTWTRGGGAGAPIEFDRRAFSVFGGGGPTAQTYSLLFGSLKAINAAQDKGSTSSNPWLDEENAAMPNVHPQWVGDPLHQNWRTKSAQWRVSSCDDYGYKKNFEYMWFNETARALGSDYRAVYDLAMRPDSPLKQRDKTQHSFGPYDSPWQVGGALDPYDMAVYKTNLILLYSQDNLGSYDVTFQPVPGGSIWAQHAKMEEAHRPVTDAEFEDIERRIQRFSETLAQLWAADFKLAEMQCKADGYAGVEGKGFEFNCLGTKGASAPGNSKGTPGKPGTTPGKMSDPNDQPQPPQKLKPRPLTDQTESQNPGVRRAQSPKTAARRTVDGKTTILQIRGLAKLHKTLKVDGPPPGAPPKGKANGASGATAGQHFGGRGGKDATDVCAKLRGNAMKICYAQAARDAIQADIDAMLAYEATLPGKGCLNTDPVKNACNWSYKLFASQVLGHAPNVVDADACRTRIPDFDVLTNPAKQKDLANKRILYPKDDIGVDYTSDIARVDWYVHELDAAPAKWAEYDKQRKDYLKYVDSLVQQTKTIPGAGANALGQSVADGFDLGHPNTFGAGAHYKLAWGITAAALGKPMYSAEPGSSCAPGVKCCNGIACGVEEKVCRFNGSMSASADAKASVFGATETFLDAAFTSYAEDDSKHGGNGAHMDAHFTFLGNELFPADVKSGINQPAGSQFTIARPLADDSRQIPDPPIEVAFMVGPIPVTLSAGSVVSAGVDLSTTGVIGDTCGQKNVPPAFSLLATIAPHARADAFGEAGVDLVAVDAGVRVDLNLVTLGLPLEVGFRTEGANVVFDTKTDLTANALAGGMSLYAEIHYVIGSDTYEMPVFSWNGVSGSKTLFDYNVSFPLDALSYRFYPPGPWQSL